MDQDAAVADQEQDTAVADPRTAGDAASDTHTNRQPLPTTSTSSKMVVCGFLGSGVGIRLQFPLPHIVVVVAAAPVPIPASASDGDARIAVPALIFLQPLGASATSYVGMNRVIGKYFFECNGKAKNDTPW
ncbi:uncharacterized protein LOC119347631 [Triticum dicoccoides]|uniref:uncharacterized protein LOC119343515 n=1 Tax=Triticum dicoccoides TaxID=85692 RepID=UPI00188E95AC|nr:uncharacterized protein LOC119343515 [Triticum dicoccoides]XP_037472112.1 uncharacterized protein LOC119347600 [Triticum dicoccoides]XP_037472130.1 uncharacterized protein LOC119347631 [Triticum dicoccoides]XP_044434959.1 uncharacterized protein LOC123161176 isoform X1 [Triticum aestivum]